MKKLLLGILLLSVIGSVLYFQTIRDSGRRSEAFTKGYQRGADSVVASRSDYDSITDLLDRERQALAEFKAAMTDSLAQRDTLYRRTLDSLTQLTGSAKVEVGDSSVKTAAGDSGTINGGASKRSASNGPDNETVLKHYKLAMSKLPADLSPYEYRVAVDEIRSETAARFSITVGRLNEIRKEHQVDF